MTTATPRSADLSVPGATVGFPDRKIPPMPTTTTSPLPDVAAAAALTVACPICDAQSGWPCRNVAGGETRRPHLYRVQVVEELVR